MSGLKASDFENPRDPLTDKVIGLAIEVHRSLGPGLFESCYAECIAHELSLASLSFEREVPIPLRYKGVAMECAYRLDFVIENQLILELKSVERFEPIHHAQLLTNLKLTGKKVGLLLNFNETLLKNGILRKIL
jgi:GxxExxY protein